MDYLPYILLAITLAIMGMQLYLYLAAKRVQGRTAPAYDDLLDSTQRDKPVLLFYFHSEYCGPCRRLTPLVTAAARHSGAVVMVDVVESTDVARRFGVRVTPTLMRIKGGVVEKVVVGDIGEEMLNRLLAE